MRATIDGIEDRTAVCERDQGATDEVTILKAAITSLRTDVDQLKATDKSMVFGTVEIPDVPEMPPVSTQSEDTVKWTVEPESEVEKNEKMLEETVDVADEDID